MTVVLVGPPGAGKSETAARLGRRWGLDVVSFDADRPRWYRPFGYTEARADRLYEVGGLAAWRRYTATFDVRALHHLVTRHTRAVIDTCGGAVLQDADSTGERLLLEALTLADLSVLVCPHPNDPGRSLDVLSQRLARRVPDDEHNEWDQPQGRQLLLELVCAAQALAGVVDTVCDTVVVLPASGTVIPAHGVSA